MHVLPKDKRQKEPSTHRRFEHGTSRSLVRPLELPPRPLKANPSELTHGFGRFDLLPGSVRFDFDLANVGAGPRSTIGLKSWKTQRLNHGVINSYHHHLRAALELLSSFRHYGLQMITTSKATSFLQSWKTLPLTLNELTIT